MFLLSLKIFLSAENLYIQLIEGHLEGKKPAEGTVTAEQHVFCFSSEKNKKQRGKKATTSQPITSRLSSGLAGLSSLPHSDGEQQGAGRLSFRACQFQSNLLTGVRLSQCFCKETNNLFCTDYSLPWLPFYPLSVLFQLVIYSPHLYKRLFQADFFVCLFSSLTLSLSWRHHKEHFAFSNILSYTNCLSFF